MDNKDFVFSVSNTLDLVGGEFEELRIDPVVASVGWRLRVRCRLGDDGIHSLAVHGAGDQSALLPINWFELLWESTGLRLEGGLKVTVALDEALPLPWVASLGHSASFAVGLVTGVAALADRLGDMPATDLASAAARLLRLLHGMPADGRRYEAACAAAARGGVPLAASDPGARTLSEIIPPESFGMVCSPDWPADAGAGLPSSVLADFPTRHAALLDRVDLAGLDLEAVFGPAGASASEFEQSVLYASIRVREVIGQLRACLDAGYMDNDALGEMLDDESDLLVDYLGYNPGRMAQAREVATGASALGCKYSVLAGRIPVMLFFAPTGREDVTDALESAHFHCMDVDFDPLGVLLEDDPPPAER